MEKQCVRCVYVYYAHARAHAHARIPYTYVEEKKCGE